MLARHAASQEKLAQLQHSLHSIAGEANRQDAPRQMGHAVERTRTVPAGVCGSPSAWHPVGWFADGRMQGRAVQRQRTTRPNAVADYVCLVVVHFNVLFARRTGAQISTTQWTEGVPPRQRERL